MRIVTVAPSNGSIAAFDMWNSSTQTANASSCRLVNNRRSPGQSNSWVVVCCLACGPRPIANNARSAGTHSAAVSRNTLWLDT